MTHLLRFVNKFYIVGGEKYCTETEFSMNVLTWLVCGSIQMTVNIIGHFLSLSQSRDFHVTCNDGARKHDLKIGRGYLNC